MRGSWYNWGLPSDLSPEAQAKGEARSAVVGVV
jgi:hypothetical protein